MSIYNVDKNVIVSAEDRKWYQVLRRKYYPPEYIPHLKKFNKNKFKKR
jgi:hypothetical protein